MHVPVVDFVGLGLADGGDFDSELEVDPGQRVVGIDGDVISHDGGDLSHAGTVGGVRLEAHARLQVHALRELGAGRLDDQIGIMFPVGLGGRDLGDQLVPGDLSFQLLFQTGNDIAVTVQVGEGVPAFTGIEDLSLGIGQGVMHRDDVVVFDFHGGRLGASLLAMQGNTVNFSTMDQQQQYEQVVKHIGALIEGETDEVAVMATVACELHHAFAHFHWTGFYRVTEPGLLKVGPYQGGHGCLVIPFGKGVCGHVAQTGQLLRLDDVDSFPDHIACSSTTRSEIVVPVKDANGAVRAVLDIDSDHPAAFDEEDELQLDRLCKLLCGQISWTR